MRIHILHFDARVGAGTWRGWLTECGCEITDWTCYRQNYPEVRGEEPVLLLGGHDGVNDRRRLPYLQQAVDWLQEAVRVERPLLALCLGAQLLACSQGAAVQSGHHQERGVARVGLTPAGRGDPLFAGLSDPFCSFQWHNDSFAVPAAADHLARTDPCPAQAFRVGQAWGVQFHPEVDAQIVSAWARRAGCGEGPRRDFLEHRTAYQADSRRLLENFLHLAKV